MTDIGLAISWMVLSPISFLTDILAVVVVSHYFPFFHGTDVTLISIMVAMAGNAMFVLPIPAYLELRDEQWTSNLCIGYAWCVLTFRLAQILSLMVISIHWSTLLKMSAQKKKYVSTKFLKITIVFIWITSTVFGFLPLIGVSSETFALQNSCTSLAYNIGTGYGIFFLIIILTAIFVSVLCSLDAMILIKHMKVIAKTKYQAGRFHLPDRRADVPVHGSSSLAEKYHRLQFAWDLSKFALVFILLSFLGNHLPYAVIQAMQLFTHTDQRTLEVISLYLVGAEALLLPHTLWLLSRRYRHALTYQWQVHVLRNKDKEEDEPYSCTLQSYTQRERDRVSQIPSRPASSVGRSDHVSATSTLKSIKSEGLNKDHVQINGQTVVATVFRDDGRTHSPRTNDRRVNGVIHGEVYVEKPPSLYDERPVDIQNLESDQKQHFNKKTLYARKVSDESSYSIKSEQPRSQSSNAEIIRSSSARSRRDWKERMRKKHLPPIFVNEAFEDKSPTSENLNKQNTMYKHAPTNISGNSLHFYMSSDYHPDYLTDSLPRRKLYKGPSSESEMGEPYNVGDIDDALDDDSVTDMQIVRAKAAYAFKDESNRTDLTTFKADPQKTSSSHGLYNTFEDLSTCLREDEEMIHENETVSEPDATNYDSAEGSPPALHNKVSTISFPRLQAHFSSFKPDAEVNIGQHSSLHKNVQQSDKHFTAYYPNSFANDSRQLDTYDIGRNPFESLSLERQCIYTVDSMNKHISNNTLMIDSWEETNRNSQHSLGESTGFPVTDIERQSERKLPLQDDRKESSESGSVTVVRYDAEERSKPWMYDFDQETDEHSQIGDPLFQESDTDTLRDSHESSDFRLGINFDERYQGTSHSELCTPVSSIFDEETDRGFEEALEMHVSANSSVYAGVGLCFESIEEEPEDLSRSGSNPFLSNGNFEDKFRTQAVISRSSNSRTSSTTSLGENPFTGSPSQALYNISDRTVPTRTTFVPPKIITTDIDSELCDSGFTSGPDRDRYTVDSPDITMRGSNSPWPDVDNDGDSSLTFESDFNSGKKGSYCINDSRFKYLAKLEQSVDAFENDTYLMESRKPVHKLLQAVKSGNKPQPVRVKSLESSSPAAVRKPPRRGHSFEGPRTDVKPAYF